MYTCYEDLIWLSHASQEGRYTRRTLPTLHRDRCAVCLFRTGVHREYGQNSAVHMRANPDFISEFFRLRAKFAKIFHQVVNVEINYVLKNFLMIPFFEYGNC